MPQIHSFHWQIARSSRGSNAEFHPLHAAHRLRAARAMAMQWPSLISSRVEPARMNSESPPVDK